METAQCLVDRAVKLDAVDTTSVDGRGAELDNIDVERILERACYGARRRLPLYQGGSLTRTRCRQRAGLSNVIILQTAILRG